MGPGSIGERNWWFGAQPATICFISSIKKYLLQEKTGKAELFRKHVKSFIHQMFSSNGSTAVWVVGKRTSTFQECQCMLHLLRITNILVFHRHCIIKQKKKCRGVWDRAVSNLFTVVRTCDQ